MPRCNGSLLKKTWKENGVRKWSLITYDKYDETDKRNYSIEINFCEEDDVPYMLREHSIGKDIKLNDLNPLVGMGKSITTQKFLNSKKIIEMKNNKTDHL